MAWRYLWVGIAPLVPDDFVNDDNLFPLPRSVTDYFWMTGKHVANGFAEELVMRAYLITRLERLLGSGSLAVLVSSLLFASYHIYYGPGVTLIHAVLFGLAFGGLYLLLRRVWPLALAHALINISNELQWL